MAHRGLHTDEELLRQMLPDDCFWLAPVSALPVPGLADNAPNYAAFLDYSHRVNQPDWLHPSNSIPQELQAALIEQPVGTFLFHENHCTLLEGQRDIANDSESSCSSSSSSAGSSSYLCSGETHHQNNTRAHSAGPIEDSTEPQNLSSQVPIQVYSLVREKSTSPKEKTVKTEISNR